MIYKTNEELIQSLKTKGVLRSNTIEQALRFVDRKYFVPKDYINQAYGDYPISIFGNQTISQPYTVVFMLELLKPKVGEKILDVGSGSGWTTALLAKLVGLKGYVAGAERILELVKFSKKNILHFNFLNIEINLTEKILGMPSKAPYDKILVSATAKHLLGDLIKQMKIGGVMVVPIKNSIWHIRKISDDKIEKKEYFGFSFVPLVEF